MTGVNWYKLTGRNQSIEDLQWDIYTMLLRTREDKANAQGYSHYYTIINGKVVRRKPPYETGE